MESQDHGSRAILRHLPQAQPQALAKGRSPRQAHPERRNDTGERKREEKSLEQVQENRLEELTSLQDPASIARHRYWGGRASPKLKEGQPDRKSHSSSPPIDLGVTKTPKEKEKGKNGRQAPEPLLQLATRGEGDEAEDGYRAGRMTQRCSPFKIRSRRDRQHP